MSTFLRPEARPLPLDDLHPSQKTAFWEIVNAIRQAAFRPENKNYDDSCAPVAKGATYVEDSRTNQVLFLSGERGTGKTSLLLTVQREIRPRNPEPQSSNTSPNETLGSLRQSQVIWLEPLDMDPLPRPTNVLAAILARIDRAVSSASVDERPQSGWTSFGESEDALVALHRLKCNVSLAWDGNLEQRAGQLDPDTYAQEVMRAEDARLTVNPQLRVVLDKLAKTVYHRTQRQPVLFILPVDDCDVNPARCVELLRLLRMITVPRLLVITLGSINAIERMFELATAGSFAQLGYNSLARGMYTRTHTVPFTRQVALDALRKIVPPSHRIHIRHLSITEAMDFKPDGRKESLRDELAKCKFPLVDAARNGRIKQPLVRAASEGIVEQSDARYGSLLGLLDPRRPSRHLAADSEKRTEADKKEVGGELPSSDAGELGVSGERVGIGAGRLLVGPARRVLDTWLDAFAISECKAGGDDVSQHRNAERLAGVAVRWLHAALREDPHLSSMQVERLCEAAQVAPDGTPIFDRTAFHVGADTRWFDDITIQLLDTATNRAQLPSIQLRFLERWVVAPRNGKEPRSTPPQPHAPSIGAATGLSDHSVACFELVNDLCCLALPDAIKGHNPIPRTNMDPCVIVTWNLPEKCRLSIPWVGPMFDTFVEATQFATSWNTTLRDYEDNRTNIIYPMPFADIFGINWIAAATEYTQGAPFTCSFQQTPMNRLPWDRFRSDHTDDERRAVKDAVIAQLCEDTERIAHYANGYPAPVRSWRARGWLCNLAVLLAPESGIDRSVATEFCAYEQLKKFWMQPANCRMIRRIRAWLASNHSPDEKLETRWNAASILVNPQEYGGNCLAVINSAALPESGRDEAKAAKEYLVKLFDAKYSARELEKRLASPKSLDRVATEIVRKLSVICEEMSKSTDNDLRHVGRQIDAQKPWIPLWVYSMTHPVNQLTDLCPNQGDVPADPTREGLWPIVVL